MQRAYLARHLDHSLGSKPLEAMMILTRFWVECPRDGEPPLRLEITECFSLHLQDAHSILDPVPGLTLDPQALLVLDDEVLLGLLQLLQLVLRVLGDQAQLLKRLVDLKVLLGHGINQDTSRGAALGTE